MLKLRNNIRIWMLGLSFIIFHLSPVIVKAQVGTWRNYLAYSEVQQICAAGDNLFVRASNGLYQYNKNDQSIYTYDKTNGLSDTNIKLIAWNRQAKRLIAVYMNSNIDLIDTNNNIINISSLYTKTTTEDKTVSSIRIDGIYAYLICGFGIVKVNMQRAEITDTYTPNHPEYPTSLPEEDNSDYDKYIDLVSKLNPGGPKYNYFGFMKFTNNRLYTCGGGYIPTNELLRPGTIQILDNKEEWTICQDNLKEITNTEYVDVDALDVNPNNPDHIFASGRTGAYEFLNLKFVKHYSYDNSLLSSVFGTDKNYVVVQSVKFYDNQVLFLTSMVKQNHFTSYNKTEDKWTDLSNNEILENTNDLKELMIDNDGYIWFVNDHWDNTSLFRYNPSTNTFIKWDTFINEDGMRLSVHYIHCITEDLNYNIWLGTNVGPLILEKDDKANANAQFTQVKVPRNDGTNYADYLLNGIEIKDIEIDGAGRKWFGTLSNGVYEISEDNLTQLNHFTKENSKLLSDNIESLAIDNSTGRVYIATDYGLCSYVTDAINPNQEMNKDNVWAYPNPVTHDYTGLITITGLSYNASIKIVSSNGALIAEGQSNGGIFTWDGCDKDGKRVASGVYMVISATNDGNKGTVCKIAVIN